MPDVRSWCIHPGGPRILSAIAEGLELDRALLGPSRQVLAEHGNMSSPIWKGWRGSELPTSVVPTHYRQRHDSS
jgi:hypothetical protein